MIPKPRPPRLNCLSLILFSAALPLQGIYADDGISRILQAWNEHYGTFAESKQYHYRCVVKRICKKPGFSLNRCQLPAVQELGLEIFRLGQASRMDAVRGGDFSSIDESGAMHVFDGRAGITSQPQRADSRYYQIYPASRDVETLQETVQPYADPLADVLGLSVRADVASWALGIGASVDRSVVDFDLATALAQGTFQIVSEDANVVEVRDANGDRVALSIPHNFAIARRTWTWELDTVLKCALENRDWKQFSDGTWYPEVSELVCSGRFGTDREQVLLAVDYRFSALPASKASDFEITVDRPGTDIEYRDGGNGFRSRTLKEGERIDLTRLAHNQLSIRWDTWGDAPYSVLEKWNAVPLMLVAVCLAVRCVPGGRIRSCGLWPQRAIWLSLVQGGLFLLLIHVAMWLYQGGTRSNKDLTSYSWTHNFLSDLGREYRYDNGDNRPVNILFMLALGVAGTGTMLYAWRLPDLFQRPGSRRFATLALACGVLAGWSYIRIGLAPLDVQHDEHHFFAIAGFVSFAAMGLSYAVALLLEADYPNRYGWSLLALCALLGAYVLLREFEGPHWLSASALFWKATAQKVVVYCQVLCMAIQAKGGLKWLDRQAAKDVAGPVL
ncbi:MAG TPA: DUF998 domain-containing protein [Pirellulales bacterium]|nr:DUF998 domain-containing protein [Pirellulales bacterium]